MDRKRERGLTLLELLVVLAIIGILSVIAIVNYFAALTRARQKRTVADIRTIAMAWEARASETMRYNAAGFTFPSGAMSHEQLSNMLMPTYAKTLPRMDGWSRPLEFSLVPPAAGAAAGGATGYAIRSAGRDGRFDATYTPGATTDPDCDIVYSGGSFILYPDVIQNER